MNDNRNIEPVISVAEMARRIQISRSRLYQLIDQNVMLPPALSIATHMPLYTETMAERNLEVKRKNVGINGQIVMFYVARNLPQPTAINKIRKPKTESKNKPLKNEYSQLIQDLKALGLEQVTMTQVESAVKTCYPLGVSQVDENEVLRTIFRHLKCQNSEHNQRTK